jgi:hypothetical protein
MSIMRFIGGLQKRWERGLSNLAEGCSAPGFLCSPRVAVHQMLKQPKVGSSPMFHASKLWIPAPAVTRR